MDLQPLLMPHEVQNYHNQLNQINQSVVAMGEDGNCVYLTPEGCKIYRTRPQACQDYDCRNALRLVLESDGGAFTKVLLAAAMHLNDDKH